MNGVAETRPSSERWASPKPIAVLVPWIALLAICGPYVAWSLASVPGMRIPLNLLFFLPQWMFPFFGAVRRSPYESTAVFSSAAQYWLSAGLWTSVAIAYARFARGCRLSRLVWLSPVVIVCVTLLVNAVLGLGGAGVELDGP